MANVTHTDAYLEPTIELSEPGSGGTNDDVIICVRGCAGAQAVSDESDNA